MIACQKCECHASALLAGMAFARTFYETTINASIGWQFGHKKITTQNINERRSMHSQNPNIDNPTIVQPKFESTLAPVRSSARDALITQLLKLIKDIDDGSLDLDYIVTEITLQNLTEPTVAMHAEKAIARIYRDSINQRLLIDRLENRKSYIIDLDKGQTDPAKKQYERKIWLRFSKKELNCQLQADKNNNKNNKLLADKNKHDRNYIRIMHNYTIAAIILPLTTKFHLRKSLDQPIINYIDNAIKIDEKYNHLIINKLGDTKQIKELLGDYKAELINAMREIITIYREDLIKEKNSIKVKDNKDESDLQGLELQKTRLISWKNKALQKQVKLMAKLTLAQEIETNLSHLNTSHRRSKKTLTTDGLSIDIDRVNEKLTALQQGEGSIPNLTARINNIEIEYKELEEQLRKIEKLSSMITSLEEWLSDKKLTKWLDQAKNWVAMEEETYTIATVTELDDGSHIIVLDEPCTKLTPEQRRILRDYATQEWFENYTAEEKILFEYYGPKLLRQQKYLAVPSQLRATAPTIKNAFRQGIYYVGQDGIPCELLAAYHSATVAHLSKKAHQEKNNRNATLITKDNLAQQKENAGTNASIMVSLNSQFADFFLELFAKLKGEFFVADDSKIISYSQSAAMLAQEENTNVYYAKTCLNAMRLIESDDVNGFRSILKIVQDNLMSITQNLIFNQSILFEKKVIDHNDFIDILEKEATYRHKYLYYIRIIDNLVKRLFELGSGFLNIINFLDKEVNGIEKIYLLSKIAYINNELIKTIIDDNAAIAAAKNPEKNTENLQLEQHIINDYNPDSVSKNRISSTQLKANISKYDNSLSSPTDNLQTIAIYFGCASGENRTGIAEIVLMMLAILHHLNLKLDSDKAKDICTRIASDQAVVVNKGFQGSTMGTEGIRDKSMGSLPESFCYLSGYLVREYGDFKNIESANKEASPSASKNKSDVNSSPSTPLHGRQSTNLFPPVNGAPTSPPPENPRREFK